MLHIGGWQDGWAKLSSLHAKYYSCVHSQPSQLIKVVGIINYPSMIQYDADSFFTLHFHFNSIGHHEFDGSFNCHAAPFYFYFFHHPNDTNDKSLTVSGNIQRQIDLLPQMGFSLCYNSFCVMKLAANRHKRNKLPPSVFSWLAGWQGAPHLVYDLLAEKRETALSLGGISLKNSDASPKCAGRKTNEQKKSWKHSEKMLAAACLCSRAVQHSVAPYQKQSEETNAVRAKTYMTSFLGRYCWIN